VNNSPSRKNLKHSITKFGKGAAIYWTLDNAAIIMPAVSSERRTFLFRLSASLDHPIVFSAMNRAFKRVCRRFPYFLVHLRRGFFWYYLQPVTQLPELEPDFGPANIGMSLKDKNRFLFRVRLRGNRIACEFSHILTDGTGAMIFLRTLVTAYFNELGVKAEPDSLPEWINLDEEPFQEEYEDAYQRFYKSSIPKVKNKPLAYHIKSELLPPGQYRVICGMIPVAELSLKAKTFGVSINDILVAAYFSALYKLRKSELSKTPVLGKKPKPLLSVEVPINLRKFYKTRTMRNFTLFALPSMDARFGEMDFEKLVKRVHYLMRLKGDEASMAIQIQRNAGSTRNLLVRMTPLVIKDFFARILFNRLGEGMMSGLISNIGPVSLPKELESHVKRIDFIGAPSTIMKTGASAISWNGMLYISFHSLAKSTELEKLFFRCLASLGLHIKVENKGE